MCHNYGKTLHLVSCFANVVAMSSHMMLVEIGKYRAGNLRPLFNIESLPTLQGSMFSLLNSSLHLNLVSLGH